MKLFEINTELREILESFVVDEETGEILCDIDTERINELTVERNNKIEGLALFAKELSVDIEALKAEKKVLEERAKVKEKRLESLKNYLSYALESCNFEKFETTRTVISFRKSEAVEVLDEGLIPDEYMKTKVEVTPDKTAIKKAIKNGISIEGAELVERKNIQIK